MMELSSLELKVISCRHLKAFNFFQRLSVYAAVSIFKDKSKSSDQQHLQRQKTPVDRDGGSRPEWNHTMKFDIRSIDLTDDESDHLFLKFDLRCDGIVYGKKCIGEVRVPFKDLVDEFNGTVRFLSYQVRSSEGKANGVLNFSYKIHCKTKEMSCSESKIPVCDKKVQYPSLDHRVTHTPARDKKRILYPSLDDIQSSSTGLVTVPTPRFGASPLMPHTVANETFYHLYHNHVPMYAIETAARYGPNGYNFAPFGGYTGVIGQSEGRPEEAIWPPVYTSEAGGELKPIRALCM